MEEPSGKAPDVELSDESGLREVNADDVRLIFGDLAEGEAKEMERRANEEMRGNSNGPFISIADTLAKVSLEDGGEVDGIWLSNTIKPRAVVTSVQTAFEVVWYKPHRNIWLHYQDKKAAEDAFHWLEGGKIAGVLIRCLLKESPRSTACKHRVLLQDMPDEVQAPLLRQHLLAGMDTMPKRIDFGKLNYPRGQDAISHIRKRIKERTGERIKQHDFIPVENGLKMKAEVRLHADAANLAAHAKALNGITIPELGNGKVFCVERLRVYVALDSAVYKRHSKAFKGIAHRAWSEHAILVKILDGELRYRQSTYLVSLEGNGREAICKVKAEIDKCVGSDVETSLQRSKQQPVRKHKITLNLAKEYHQAVTGGLERLQQFYGEEFVAFSADGDPPTLLIETSDDKFAKAESLLFKKKLEQGPNMGDCPICAEEVLLLKIPGCEHNICENCINAYCTNATAGHFPLKCFSAFGCDTLLNIHWLQKHLSPAALQSLTRTIITAHCQENTNNFIKCAGPDCDQWQHLATSKKFSKVICPSCLTVNCTSCRTEYHFGETCAESIARRDPQEDALRRHLEEVGGKRCPRCDTPAIRIDGCSHMECPACNAHWCWRCLAHFPTPELAYEHLRNVHGGPFEFDDPVRADLGPVDD